MNGLVRRRLTGFRPSGDFPLQVASAGSYVTMSPKAFACTPAAPRPCTRFFCAMSWLPANFFRLRVSTISANGPMGNLQSFGGSMAPHLVTDLHVGPIIRILTKNNKLYKPFCLPCRPTSRHLGFCDKTLDSGFTF